MPERYVHTCAHRTFDGLKCKNQLLLTKTNIEVKLKLFYEKKENNGLHSRIASRNENLNMLMLQIVWCIFEYFKIVRE